MQSGDATAADVDEIKQQLLSLAIEPDNTYRLQGQGPAITGSHTLTNKGSEEFSGKCNEHPRSMDMGPITRQTIVPSEALIIEGKFDPNNSKWIKGKRTYDRGGNPPAKITVNWYLESE